MNWMTRPVPLTVLLGIALLAGCARVLPASNQGLRLSDPATLPQAGLAAGERLTVVATTSIVADVVGAVAGDWVSLHSLVPTGVDPHAFEPTPQDLARAVAADVVFLNGFGLDSRLAEMLTAAGVEAPLVSLSEGVTALSLGEAEAPGSEAAAIDPHTWLDPNNVLVWVENARAGLSALVPAHAADFRDRAATYAVELQALDAQIRRDLEAIPVQDRRLVTDHDEFGYFARRYGFTVVGAVIPGFSTGAEPSPQELAALEQAIRELHIRAIFVSSVVTPDLAERVAEDTGIRLVTLTAHTLTGADGPAPDYLSLMRYNVAAIVEALSPAAAVDGGPS